MEYQLPLSQSYLQILQTCPRKFQYTYLEHLAPPWDAEQQERLQWGADFHRLMQQQAIGLPPKDANLRGDYPEELLQTYQALQRQAPQLFASQGWRATEYPLSWLWGGYRFTVIYDLLFIDGQQAEIIDWKTHQYPKTSQNLRAQWQTKLYLFGLAECSGWPPDQLRMTYWFVRGQPTSVTIAYSATWHGQIRKELGELLDELNGYWQRYTKEGVDFDQVAVSAGHCQKCSFVHRCDRTHADLPSPDLIPEIAL
jgi:hypothetical protein